MYGGEYRNNDQAEKNRAEHGEVHPGADTLLLENLNEVNLDEMANQCERLHKLSEQLHDGLKKEVDRDEQETIE